MPPCGRTRFGLECVLRSNPSRDRCFALVWNLSLLPYLWMLCGAFSFACMVAFAHGLQEECDWQVVALARAALALLITVALALAARVRLVIWRPKTLWIRSIAGSISMLCTFYAVPRLPMAVVLTVSNVFPVWVALLSWPLLGEKPSTSVWLAITSAVCGVALVQQAHFRAADPSVIVALFGSFATAVAMIGLHRLSDIDVRAIVVHFSAVGTLFCIAAMALFPMKPIETAYFDTSVVLQLVGVGVAATLGQIMLTKAFTTGNAAKVSVVAISQIAFAMLFDVAFWGRRFTPENALGHGNGPGADGLADVGRIAAEAL